MFNIKETHRATTAMREAFEAGLRKQVNSGEVPAMAGAVSDALHANHGVVRVKDVALNVSVRSWKQIERLLNPPAEKKTAVA